MRNDLTWGWVSTILAIMGVILIVICICIGNWNAIPMCIIALFFNAGNAAIHFHEYKRRKQEWKDCMERFERTFNACWPEENEDKSEDDNRITD